MIMALLQEKSYTIDDIYALSDGTRAELIDGDLKIKIEQLLRVIKGVKESWQGLFCFAKNESNFEGFTAE